MKMNLHCFANLISIMILELFSNSGLINATEFGKRTDALEASAWNESKWISAVDAPVVKGHNNGRAADGASWFVSTVKNEQKIVSAKWMTAGLGVYELYVNGKPVGGEFLKPGFTHYAKTKRSFTYDITDIIRTKPNAENMLSVQVTPGWWGDKIITPGGYDGMIGKKCAFRGVLELTFSDGNKKRYGTDLKNWKAGIAGPVKHAVSLTEKSTMHANRWVTNVWTNSPHPKRTPNSPVISCLRTGRKSICVQISPSLLSKHTFGRM